MRTVFCHNLLEHLDAVVLTVTHQNVAIGHDGNTLQTLELTLTRPPAAKGPKEGAIRVEDLDAVVATVRHENVPLVIHRHAPESKERISERALQ